MARLRPAVLLLMIASSLIAPASVLAVVSSHAVGGTVSTATLTGGTISADVAGWVSQSASGCPKSWRAQLLIASSNVLLDESAWTNATVDSEGGHDQYLTAQLVGAATAGTQVKVVIDSTCAGTIWTDNGISVVWTQGGDVLPSSCPFYGTGASSFSGTVLDCAWQWGSNTTSFNQSGWLERVSSWTWNGVYQAMCSTAFQELGICWAHTLALHQKLLGWDTPSPNGSWSAILASPKFLRYTAEGVNFRGGDFCQSDFSATGARGEPPKLFMAVQFFDAAGAKIPYVDTGGSRGEWVSPVDTGNGNYCYAAESFIAQDKHITFPAGTKSFRYIVAEAGATVLSSSFPLTFWEAFQVHWIGQADGGAQEAPTYCPMGPCDFYPSTEPGGGGTDPTPGSGGIGCGPISGRCGDEFLDVPHCPAVSTISLPLIGDTGFPHPIEGFAHLICTILTVVPNAINAAIDLAIPGPALGIMTQQLIAHAQTVPPFSWIAPLTSSVAAGAGAAPGQGMPSTLTVGSATVTLPWADVVGAVAPFRPIMVAGVFLMAVLAWQRRIYGTFGVGGQGATA